MSLQTQENELPPPSAPPSACSAPFVQHRHLPSILLDSWEFRKLAPQGSVLPNAMISHDVDHDGLEEVIMGTTEGLLCVVKPDHRAPLFVRVVAATISIVLYAPASTRLVLITLEGQCEVIENFMSTYPYVPCSDIEQGTATTVNADREDGGVGCLSHSLNISVDAPLPTSLAGEAARGIHGAPTFTVGQGQLLGGDGTAGTIMRGSSHNSLADNSLTQAMHQSFVQPSRIFHVQPNCFCGDLSPESDSGLIFLGSTDRHFYVYSLLSGSCLLSLFMHDAITSIKAFAINTSAPDRCSITPSSTAIRKNETAPPPPPPNSTPRSVASEAVPLHSDRMISASHDDADAGADAVADAMYLPLVFLSTPTHLILLPGDVGMLRRWSALLPPSSHLPLTVQLESELLSPRQQPPLREDASHSCKDECVSSGMKASSHREQGASDDSQAADLQLGHKRYGRRPPGGGGAMPLLAERKLNTFASGAGGSSLALTPPDEVVGEANLSPARSPNDSPSQRCGRTVIEKRKEICSGVEGMPCVALGSAARCPTAKASTTNILTKAAGKDHPVLVKPLWALRIGSRTLEVPPLHATACSESDIEYDISCHGITEADMQKYSAPSSFATLADAEIIARRSLRCRGSSTSPRRGNAAAVVGESGGRPEVDDGDSGTHPSSTTSLKLGRAMQIASVEEGTSRSPETRSSTPILSSEGNAAPQRRFPPLERGAVDNACAPCRGSTLSVMDCTAGCTVERRSSQQQQEQQQRSLRNDGIRGERGSRLGGGDYTDLADRCSNDDEVSASEEDLERHRIHTAYSSRERSDTQSSTDDASDSSDAKVGPAHYSLDTTGVSLGHTQDHRHRPDAMHPTSIALVGCRGTDNTAVAPVQRVGSVEEPAAKGYIDPELRHQSAKDTNAPVPTPLSTTEEMVRRGQVPRRQQKEVPRSTYVRHSHDAVAAEQDESKQQWLREAPATAAVTSPRRDDEMRLPTSLDVAVGSSQVAVALCREDGLAMELRFSVARLSTLSRKQQSIPRKTVLLYSMRKPPDVHRHSGGAGCAHCCVKSHASCNRGADELVSFEDSSSFRQGMGRHLAHHHHPSSCYKQGRKRVVCNVYLPVSVTSPRPRTEGARFAPPAISTLSTRRFSSSTQQQRRIGRGLPPWDSGKAAAGLPGAMAVSSPAASSDEAHQLLSPEDGDNKLVLARASERLYGEDDVVVLRAECRWAAWLTDTPLLQRARVFRVHDRDSENVFCAMFVAANGASFAVDGDTLTVVESSVKDGCSTFSVMAGPPTTMPLPQRPSNTVAQREASVNTSFTCSNDGAGRFGYPTSGFPENRSFRTACGAAWRRVACVCVSVDELCVYSTGESNQALSYWGTGKADGAGLSQLQGYPLGSWEAQLRRCTAEEEVGVPSGEDDDWPQMSREETLLLRQLAQRLKEVEEENSGHRISDALSNEDGGDEADEKELLKDLRQTLLFGYSEQEYVKLHRWSLTAGRL